MTEAIFRAWWPGIDWRPFQSDAGGGEGWVQLADDLRLQVSCWVLRSVMVIVDIQAGNGEARLWCCEGSDTSEAGVEAACAAARQHVAEVFRILSQSTRPGGGGC